MSDDELHNYLIKTKKGLYAYRMLLINILAFYDNREKSDSVTEEKFIQSSHKGSCNKK